MDLKLGNDRTVYVFLIFSKEKLKRIKKFPKLFQIGQDGQYYMVLCKTRYVPPLRISSVRGKRICVEMCDVESYNK